MLMNEYDIDDAVYALSADGFSDDLPNALAAAEVLLWLRDWTNDGRSDGWMYWRKPSNASKRLQEVVQDILIAQRFGTPDDLDPRVLAEALRPIKSFLTRQGVKPVDRPEILR